MEQQNQFDNLHVQAMALADSALSHIAETTACTDAQNSRILQRTLEKAGIEQTQHIKQHPVHHGKRRLRMLAAAAAAAVTVVVAALGVSGRLTYNKPLAERNFGILGAARLEELNLPKPVTYTTGTVYATVEATLCDGNCVLVLMTMETVDPGMKIDWDKELRFHEKGMPVGGWYHIYSLNHDTEVYGNQCWLSCWFEINQDAPADSATLVLDIQHKILSFDPERKEAYDEIPDDLHEDAANPILNQNTQGLEIEIPLTVNTPVRKLTADNGNTVFLSGFELFAEGYLAFGESMETVDDSYITAHRQNGTEQKICLSYRASGGGSDGGGSTRAPIYLPVEGKRYFADKPDSFIGFVDVSDVTAIDLDGMTYYLTAE